MNSLSSSYRKWLELGRKGPLIGRDGVVRYCDGFRRCECPNCEHVSHCRINGKLSLMKNFKIDKLNKKEKVIFT